MGRDETENKNRSRRQAWVRAGCFLLCQRSIHDNGAHRTPLGAVAASQTAGLVNLGKSVFIVCNSFRMTDTQAGTTAFAVLLVHVHFLFRYIWLIAFFHAARQITTYIVYFRFVAKPSMTESIDSKENT